MITLGIDTSNYATSVALVDNDTHQVIFSEKRFLPVDEGKIGLRQQQALFEHIKNLTNIFSSFFTLLQKNFCSKNSDII